MSLRNFKAHLPIRFLIARHSCCHLTARYLLFGPGPGKVLRCIISQNLWAGSTFHFKSECLIVIALIHLKSNFRSEFTCGCLGSLTCFILQHASLSSAPPELPRSFRVRGCACLSLACIIPSGETSGWRHPGSTYRRTFIFRNGTIKRNNVFIIQNDCRVFVKVQ